MALNKTVLDVPLLTGLSQKFDPRLAPNGVAIQATNLVKSKRDTLQKRLGFNSLTKTSIAGTYTNTVGLNLGTHEDRLAIFGSGAWIPTGQTINTLSYYSDNLRFTQPVSLVPEVMAKPGEISTGMDGIVLEADVAIFGNYMVLVWSESRVSLGFTHATIRYQVTEIDTGNVILGPADLETGNNSSHPVLMACGSTIVCVYILGSAIVGRKLSGTAPLSGFGSSTNIVTGLTTVAYDAESVSGDPANFVIGYQTGMSGSFVLNISKVLVSSLAVQLTSTVTDATLGNSNALLACGVTASTTSGVAVIAYQYATGANASVVGAASATYPSMPGSITGSGTSLFNKPSGDVDNYSVGKLGVCYIGTQPTASVGPQPSFSIWFSPSKSVLDVKNTFGKPARIQYLQFYFDTGTHIATLSHSNAARITHGVCLVSRPTVINGNPYAIAWIPSKIQGTYLLLAADFYRSPSDGNPNPLRAIATLAPRSINQDPYVSGVTVSTALTLWHVPLSPNASYSTYIASVPISITQQRTSLTTYQLQFSPKDIYESAMHGSSLAFASGVPSVFDGSTVAEISFFYYPEVYFDDAIIGAPTGGQSLSVGSSTDVYSWIFTYEWFDGKGQKHISARSPAVTITGAQVNTALGGGGIYPQTFSVQWNVPTLGVTSKQMPSQTLGPQNILQPGAGVTLGVYRTVVNQPTYYRISDPFYKGQVVNATPTDMDAVFNQISQASISYVDSQSDATISAFPLLYGDGTDGVSAVGNMDTFCPPSSSIIVKHKNRLFLAEGNRVWYTKSLTQGEGPGFNEQTMLFTVGDSSPITGLASMDDALIIYKRKTIWYVPGDGPADDGTGNDFFPPQPIPTELGCKDGRSIEVTPEGCYFMSDAGYRLLSRARVVEYAGLAIEDALKSYPILTGAALHPSSNRMILCANTDDVSSPLNGIFMVRDYSVDAWTQCVLANGNGIVTAGLGIVPRIISDVNGIIVNGYAPVLHLLQANGTVMRENDPLAALSAQTVYEDDNIFVPSTLQISWIKPADSIQGFARVWQVVPLVELLDPAALVIKVYLDYNPNTPINTATFQPSTLSTSATIVRPAVRLAKQRCRAVSVIIGDVAPSDGSTVLTGQGMNILGMTFDVGQYPGTSRSNPGDRQ